MNWDENKVIYINSNCLPFNMQGPSAQAQFASFVHALFTFSPLHISYGRRQLASTTVPFSWYTQIFSHILDVWSPLGRPWHTPKGWKLKFIVAFAGSLFVISEFTKWSLGIERRYPAPSTRTPMFELTRHAEDDDPTFERDPESWAAKYWSSQKESPSSPWDVMFQPPAHVDSAHSKK